MKRFASHFNIIQIFALVAMVFAMGYAYAHDLILAKLNLGTDRFLSNVECDTLDQHNEHKAESDVYFTSCGGFF